MSEGVFDLRGRLALVTGADGCPGRAFVRHLAAAGASVAAIDDHPVEGLDGAACAVVAELADVGEARRAVDAVVDELGGIDLIVNNGTRRKPTPARASREQALADYHELVDANTRRAFLVQRATVDGMIARGGGDIVNVTIPDVLPPRPGTGGRAPDTDLQTASMWSLSGFTQAWALTLRRHAIRVNALAVEAGETPAWHDAQAGLLLALLAEGPEGRSGETIGAWIGQPLALPARRRRGEDIV